MVHYVCNNLEDVDHQILHKKFAKDIEENYLESLERPKWNLEYPSFNGDFLFLNLRDLWRLFIFAIL